jgi:hypothetical protein
MDSKCQGSVNTYEQINYNFQSGVMFHKTNESSVQIRFHEFVFSESDQPSRHSRCWCLATLVPDHFNKCSKDHHIPQNHSQSNPQVHPSQRLTLSPIAEYHSYQIAEYHKKTEHSTALHKALHMEL